MKYQHGINFKLEGKDISKEDIKELINIVGNFLINKNYKNVEVSRVGVYDKNFNEIWEKYNMI